jgi:hypothetical protein
MDDIGAEYATFEPSSSYHAAHVHFMAPELLVPSNDRSNMPTRSSDVFAFGSLMLQVGDLALQSNAVLVDDSGKVYTENMPYAGLSMAQVLLKIMKGEPSSRPVDPIALERGFDDGLWDLMNDCWLFRPEERPSMSEVRRRLHD